MLKYNAYNTFYYNLSLIIQLLKKYKAILSLTLNTKIVLLNKIIPKDFIKGEEMKHISLISIFIGILLMSIEMIFSIGGKIGFLCFFSGFILLINGIVLNKKIREIVINFIFNFF